MSEFETEQATDTSVQIDIDPGNDQVIVRFFIDQERLSVPMSVDDAKKLAARIYAAAKMLRGELIEKNTRNTN